MTETVIPATYVEVRSEGLSSTGGIGAGVVGVVGTAAGGVVGEAVALGGLADARELYGAPDEFTRPLGEVPLTLVRALELVYANGASSVVAVRVAGTASESAAFVVKNANGGAVATLTARHPGTDGNGIRVLTAPADEPGDIRDEAHTGVFLNLRHARVLRSAANRIRVVRGVSRRVDTLEIVYRDVVDREQVVPDGAGRHVLARRVVTPAMSPTVSAVNAITVTAPDGTTTTYGDGDILYGTGAPPGTGEVRLNDTSGELTFGDAPPPGSTVEATYGAWAPAPERGQVLVSVWDAALDFAEDGPDADDEDRLLASYRVAAADCVAVRLERAGRVESYTVPDGTVLAERVAATSALATATADPARGGDRPATGADGYFGTGANPAGANGELAGPDDYRAGLEVLAGQAGDSVVLAGQDAAQGSGMGAVLLGHLDATQQSDHERLGVIGAPGGTVADFLGHTIASDRVVVAAPGLRLPDGVVLPPGYTAAAVAGLLGSLPVQASLTNKTLVVPGLALDVNRTDQAQLIRRDVLTAVNRQGIRVVKGVTTAGAGTPFSAIPTRRIVDFAKDGVRAAANPYLGRLNNVRVRSALKASLDAFLTGMVTNEALVSYELDVSATRAQEIAGEVAVTMTIQPTFSIEYVRVTMILR